MDEQRVKHALEHLENNTEKRIAGVYVRIKAVCKEALHKQVPKYPDFEGDGYDDSGCLIYDTWICPCCDKKYEVEYEEYDYCPNCGQRINWNKEEDE